MNIPVADLKPTPGELLGQDVWMEELEQWFEIDDIMELKKRTRRILIVRLKGGTIMELWERKKGGFVVVRVTGGDGKWR